MNETKPKRSPLFVYFCVLIPLSAAAEALIVTKSIGIFTGLLTVVCAWLLAAVMYLLMRNKIRELNA